MILKLCLFLIVLFMFPASAMAQGITIQGMVKEGEVLDKNVVLSGPAVVMDGVINGDLVAVGDKVTINGQVNGSLILTGKELILNSQVTGSTYAVGATLQVGPQANIERDVYFVGGRLETQDGSTVQRDLNILSLETGLHGSVGRDVNAVVGPINLAQGLFSLIKGEEWTPQNLLQPRSQIIPRVSVQQAIGGGVYRLSAPKNLLLISPARTSSPERTANGYSEIQQQGGTANTTALRDWAVPFIRNLASLLILGLLLVWLFPSQLIWTGGQVRTGPWRALFYGLLVFVFGWIIALLAIALVVVLAIFLYWISLPYLAFLFAMIGLIAIGLAVSVFYLSIVFLSKLVVAYAVGSLIFNRFFPKHAQSRVLPLVVGVFIYALLASIPYLGWLVAVFATLIGLGAIWMAARSRTLAESKPAAVIQPPGENLDVSVPAEG